MNVNFCHLTSFFISTLKIKVIYLLAILKIFKFSDTSPSQNSFYLRTFSLRNMSSNQEENKKRRLLQNKCHKACALRFFFFLFPSWRIPQAVTKNCLKYYSLQFVLFDFLHPCKNKSSCLEEKLVAGNMHDQKQEMIVPNLIEKKGEKCVKYMRIKT